MPSCITRQPLPAYQIPLKSKKHFVDGRTDGRTDGHLRPTLLGRLGGVDLKITVRNQAIVDIILRPRCAVSPPSRPIIDPSNACNQASAPVVRTPLHGPVQYAIIRGVRFVGHIFSRRIAPSSWNFVTLSVVDRATTIGNMHQKFGKDRVWFRIYLLGQTDTHTHRHTHHNTLQLFNLII